MSMDAARAWDAHASDYGRYFAPLTGFIAQNMFRMIEARLPAAPRILDIACGTGEMTLAAARHLLDYADGEPRGSILAMDFSEEMVALTERAVMILGAEALVECRVLDGQRLGMESGSFDAVLSSFGIFLFPDRIAGWREAARMLQPGGLFATSVWRGPEENALARLQMAPLMAALPARLTDPPPRPDWLGLTTSEGLVEEVTAAAPFVDPSISVVNATLVMPSPAAMWQAMKGNPITNRLLLACSASERDDVERAMLAHFGAEAGGSDRPLQFDASCHVLIARRA